MSGFDRSHASKHSTKRAKRTIQRLKVTLLVDTKLNAILDLHVTTTRKHDTQIAPSRINRNTAEVAVLLEDKGYDDHQIRAMAHKNGIRPSSNIVRSHQFSKRGMVGWMPIPTVNGARARR